MNTISTPNRTMVPKASFLVYAPTRNVTSSIKSWGRRGIYCGAIFGFALGAVFVAIPLSTNILTFGVFGTLLVAAVECSVLAGGFAALAAALFCNGSNDSEQNKSILSSEHHAADRGGRESEVIPAAWPGLWSHPTRSAAFTSSMGSAEIFGPASNIQNIQTRLNTIDAWENGNTGP